MLQKIEELINKVNNYTPVDSSDLENFRNQMLSKKGIISQLFDEFKTVPNEQKKDIGKKLNELKDLTNQKISYYQSQFNSQTNNTSTIDQTCPSYTYNLGSRHPVSLLLNKIISIFSRLGFTISEGPEIEDDWRVFTALNFPFDHPARDMQDTFFITSDQNVLLRTHTSSVQVRVMENQKPPIKTISPGRVFRNEAISARSHCIFHQIEGLYIDTDVSFADLKQTLLYFAKEMFGEETKIRFRPSFFPFTEPSAEMDISCDICGGKGCSVCKYTGWLEILGCGMVDPNVLENCNINSHSYTGYAFGIGIERMALQIYQISDIRYLFENDKRFLEQFHSFIQK